MPACPAGSECRRRALAFVAEREHALARAASQLETAIDRAAALGADAGLARACASIASSRAKQAQDGALERDMLAAGEAENRQLRQKLAEASQQER